MKKIPLKYLVKTKITTGASEAALDYSETKTRYIRISDFDNNGNIREDVRVSIENNKAEKYLLSKNDILIAVTGGTVGKSMIYTLEEKSAYAGYLARIQVNDKLLNYKYLWYFLNSQLFENWRKESINVSTIENISATKYSNMPILYRNIEIQNKIVKTLDFEVKKIHELMELQDYQIENLLEYKKTLVFEIFKDKIWEYKINKKIPDGFIPLITISKIIRGNSTFKKTDLSEVGKYIAIQYGNTYKMNVIDEDYNMFVDESFYKEDQLVEKGDTILVSTSEVIEELGHTAYYNKEKSGLLGGEQFVIKPYSNVEGKYLYYLSILISDLLKKYSTGIKVYRFNYDDLKNIYINLDNLENQIDVVQYLDDKINLIDKIIKLKSNKKELLEEYKQSIVYDYLVGRKEV